MEDTNLRAGVFTEDREDYFSHCSDMQYFSWGNIEEGDAVQYPGRKVNAMNIYNLFDCPDKGNDKKWLIDGIQERNENVESIGINDVLAILKRTGIWGKLRVYWITVAQSCRAIKASLSGDVLICWSSLSGIVTNLFSTILGNKRYIIAMNWLTPTASTNKVRPLLRAMAKNQMCHIIVNSPDSISKWGVLITTRQEQNAYDS